MIFWFCVVWFVRDSYLWKSSFLEDCRITDGYLSFDNCGKMLIMRLSENGTEASYLND